MTSKKNSLIGLLLFVGCIGSFAHLQPYLIKSFVEKVFAKKLAPLNKEQREEIKGIFREVGIDPDRYPILQIKDVPSCAGAMGDCILLLEKDFFKNHDKEQRRGILGHEAYHLYHHHYIRLLILLLLIDFTRNGVVNNILKLFEDKNDAFSTPEKRRSIKRIIAYIAIPFTLPIMAAIIRYSEKEADLDNARNLKTTAGDLSFFAAIKDGSHPCFKKRPKGSRWSLMRLHSGLVGSIIRYFPFHPSIDERIAYFKEEQKIQLMLDDLIPELTGK